MCPFCPQIKGEFFGALFSCGVELQVPKLFCSHLSVQTSAAHVGIAAIKGQVKCGND